MKLWLKNIIVFVLAVALLVFSRGVAIDKHNCCSCINISNSTSGKVSDFNFPTKDKIYSDTHKSCSGNTCKDNDTKNDSECSDDCQYDLYQFAVVIDGPTHEESFKFVNGRSVIQLFSSKIEPVKSLLLYDDFKYPPEKSFSNFPIIDNQIQYCTFLI